MDMEMIMEGITDKWTYCRSRIAVVVMLVLVAFVFVSGAQANDEEPAAIKPMGTCTNQPEFDIDKTAIISTVTSDVLNVISSASENMFGSVSRNVSDIMQKVIALYILIYGLLFMFGAAQASVYDFSVRLAKVSVVGMTLNGGNEIYKLLDDFFNKGTNEILNKIGCAMTGSGCGSQGASLPLASMDDLVSTIVSGKMVVTLLTIATTGVYGPLVFLVLLMSLKSLGEALLSALWVFLMSAVVRAILIAVAPIFIPCILFSRTRDMFQGWLNQLVNASLQPIFLMAFFAFFLGLVGTIVNGLLERPICLTPMVDVANGSLLKDYWWRFTKNGQQYMGDWGTSDPPFSIFNIFLLFILVELVGRFNNIVVSLANSISAATTNMSPVAAFNDWQSAMDSGASNAQSRADAKPGTGKADSVAGSATTQGTTVGKRVVSGGELSPSIGKAEYANVPAGVGTTLAATGSVKGAAPTANIVDRYRAMQNARGKIT
ncbi:MAG: type IV secretion system protein [Alphaproteobacteria bacterium]|nr:type IV secretion system protein [Alphaproteobacteria bacterium]